MNKIVRTKTRAEGGITPDEKVRMDAIAKEWTGIAFRSEPIEADKIIQAIEGLYEVAGLKKPKVVIVPSPLVMAFAYGASAWILYCATRAATNDATRAATNDATNDATYAATNDATDAATYAATYAATRAATYAATRAATDATTRAATDAAIAPVINGARSACFELAGKGGLECAKRWHNSYQGGNMWAAYPAYSAAMRDVLGLDLPEFKNYKFWEDAARHGGFRVMHQEFCIVSDFPVHIKVDENNLPHCVDGPSHLWRDGWALYHWHGQAIPEEWITKPGFLTAKIALEQENMDLRAAACEMLGWDKIIDELGGKTIDKDEDEYVGELLSVDLPDAPGTLFLRARCGTGRMIAISVVNKNCTTALEANLGSYGLPIDRAYLPEART